MLNKWFKYFSTVKNFFENSHNIQEFTNRLSLGGMESLYNIKDFKECIQIFINALSNDLISGEFFAIFFWNELQKSPYSTYIPQKFKDLLNPILEIYEQNRNEYEFLNNVVFSKKCIRIICIKLNDDNGTNFQSQNTGLTIIDKIAPESFLNLFIGMGLSGDLIRENKIDKRVYNFYNFLKNYLIIKRQKINYIIIIPAQSNFDYSSGGLVLFLEEFDEARFEKLWLWWSAISLLQQNISSYSDKIFLKKKSTQSAIAAIMSRNASHNIGSHVLSRIATKGIDGWTEGIGFLKIIDGLLLREEIKEITEGDQKRIEVGGEVWHSDEIKKADIEAKQVHVELFAKDLLGWSKDVQFLARYVQQRMDFIAQISTEWPDWSEPAYLLKDLLRWFLHQKHLLNYIAASENLGATLFDEATGTPLLPPPDVEGDIHLYVFMVPESLWRVSHVEKSQDIDEWLKIRRSRVAEYSFNDKGKIEFRHPEKGNTRGDCPCILLEMPEDQPPIVNFDLDIPLAIPGGLVGYHAFYVIIENIIRNAAKHGFVRHKNDTRHLNIVIEILYDPDEKIQIGKGDKPLPGYLLRIYDNVSQIAWNEQMRKKGQGVTLWGDGSINKKLATSIIDETGQLRKEDWGLAEMKIAAGYMQRREILHIGGENEKIVGRTGENRAELENGQKGLDVEMLNQANKDKNDTGAEAIIRAVESPIGTLGYEFFVPKPRMVGIVCKKGQS